MKTLVAVALGFTTAFLLGFTVPSAPARHPTFSAASGDITVPKVYVYDPYTGGASSGVPNVTGFNVTCSSTQGIGFNDTGSALSLVCIDSTTQTVTPTPPAAPSSSSTTVFVYQVDAGFPGMLSTIDGVNGAMAPAGLYSVFRNYGTLANWDVHCIYPRGWSDTVFVNTAGLNGQAPSVAGSLAGVAWSSASLLGRQKQVASTSNAATNSAASVSEQSGVYDVWRGDSARAGGFLAWYRLALTDTKAASRFFAGLSAAGALDLSVEPSTFTNAVFFGCSSGDTNINICTNDNAGSATCSSLGASYPCNTDGATYDFWLSAPPNASGISWAIERLDSAASTGGYLTSDLPQNTVQLSWKTGLGTGPTTSTAVIMRFFGTCFAANY